eukprot:Transcript_9914.p2 GENE.Transcript_9914~~Transcript_9914.p2  ORF type:complete len:368 (-),score=94.44 Transcript_9914:105-1136(-)
MLAIAAASLLPLAIVVVPTTPPTTHPAVAVAAAQHHGLPTTPLTTHHAVAAVFPEPTLNVPSVLVSEDRILTEEELVKRDEARRVAAIVFVAGGAPSVFAQYSLVWSKQGKPKKAAEAAAQKKAATAKTTRGGLPSEVQAVVDARFRASYPQKDVAALWKAVKTAYGTEADALSAVRANPQILNPAYTSPPGLVGRSKAALVAVLGEKEALEVMLKNPAVLQCGNSLREQPPAQLRSFANARSAVDRLPAGAPAALLGTLSLLLLFVLGGKNGAPRGDRAPQPTPPQLLLTWLVLPRGPGALPEEADGLVQAVGKLLAGVGIAATVGGAVLQNVAETGRPRRS